ncbi:MAG: hypothetical protein MJB14_04620 [Spirochaetes bacterium]|nr:hypothetical protein [Spirochaetota bacterium]
MIKKDNLFVLRILFIFHFLADIIFAIPLMFFPITALTLFGWQSIDLIAARLVAAALFAIGIESWLARNATVNQFKSLLNLKVIWSFTASFGILWSIIQGAHNRPFFSYVFLLIFVIFHFIWIYWRIRINRLS